MKRQVKTKLAPGLTGSIVETHPDKALFWDYARNADKPESYTYGSTIWAHWICPEDSSHAWEQPIMAFLTRNANCMFCARKPVLKSLRLSERYPEIAQEWHPELNVHRDPTTIKALSLFPAWWKCKVNEKHVYSVPIRSRTQDGVGCPYCNAESIAKAKTLENVSHRISNCWHIERNYDLTPEMVASDSPIVAFFKCPETVNRVDYHSIRMSIKQAVKSELSCHKCGRESVKYDVLSKTHPELVAQWHKKLNGDIKPWNVSAKSSRLVWWKCPEAFDHEWRVSVARRTANESGCPFCVKSAPSSNYSFATSRPDLLEQWHTSLNRKIDPHSIPVTYEFAVFWKCPLVKTHVWSVSVCQRTMQNSGCPYCAGRSTSRDNSLATLNPQIAKQWHPTLNVPLTPESVVAGSRKKAWWVCPKNPDHVWKCAIQHRTFSGSKCPYCCNQKIGSDNSLAVVYPEIAKQWHPKRNGALKASHLAPQSQKKVWWKCKMGPDHEWQSTLANRVHNGSGCPFCAGQGNSVTLLLSNAYPEIAKEWHKTENGAETPDMVRIADKRQFWWKCKTYDHHVWQSGIGPRIRSKGVCPICAKRRLKPGRTFWDVCPSIAKEWHDKKNNGLKASDFSPHSSQSAFWRCSKNPRHVWEATINARTTHCRGCPYCKLKS